MKGLITGVFDGIVSRFHEALASLILGKNEEINAQPKIFNRELMKYFMIYPTNGQL